MKIILGLGNVGDKYENTRHNIGFLALDRLSKEFDPNNDEKWKENSKLKAIIKEILINGEKTLLVKPTTFMNLSGECATKVMDYYKVPLKDLIVIFDDIDLPFGEIRIREKGSAGTHNGVKSLIKELGTDNIKRIKIGIENRTPEMKTKFDLSVYVLSKFDKSEITGLEKAFEEVLEKIIEFTKNFSGN
ncbi:MAG: aminoacyl-tRNA hydrolase [Candidatus Gracilibacteria bacterium]|jgi:PTH1 family peptidyl-tRNA hydrolase|nr:aminoacyl-tRNA hydrolase [Candidatus Gracilibacteria bacterium]